VRLTDQLTGTLGLVDELGTLTWRDLDLRADALAAALQVPPEGPPGARRFAQRQHWQDPSS
jgi:hypothetical protein